MKIYTKGGDKGSTSLLSGKRVKKYNLRIESYGTVDELNSHTGLLKDWISDQAINDQLQTIQNKLFNTGSILASDKEIKGFTLPEVNVEDSELLELWIDNMNAILPEMTNFILPGGHQTVSQSHVCRTVCRRAERRVTELAESENINNNLIVYLNRLSDFYFVLARFLAYKLDIQDIKWSK